MAEPEDVSASEFEALFRAMSTWGQWGENDQRGALNELTPERVAAAAQLVRDGVSVSLSLPLNTQGSADNPAPAVHRMNLPREFGEVAGSVQLAKDFVGADYHNEDIRTSMPSATSATRDCSTTAPRPTRVTDHGATADSIEVLENGLAGRGVLLDIPRCRGVSWLEPGEHVFREDLEEAERAQGVTVGPGDILPVRTGLVRRLNELGAWETSKAKPGLHLRAMPFLAERGVAALGCDGNSDTAPSPTEEVEFPIHVLALNAMGVHLLDYLALEDLRDACELSGRWEFLFIAAPLRVTGRTGSPVNPLALF